MLSKKFGKTTTTTATLPTKKKLDYILNSIKIDKKRAEFL